MKTGALIVLGDTNVSKFMGVGDTGVISAGLRLKLESKEFVFFLRLFFTLKEGILSLDLGETTLEHSYEKVFNIGLFFGEI